MDTIPVLEFDGKTVTNRDLQKVAQALHSFVLQLVNTFEKSGIPLGGNTLIDIECFEDGEVVCSLPVFDFVKKLCCLIKFAGVKLAEVKLAGCVIDEKLEKFVSDIVFSDQEFYDWAAGFIGGGWFTGKEGIEEDGCSQSSEIPETQEECELDNLLYLQDHYSLTFRVELMLKIWWDGSRSGNAIKVPWIWTEKIVDPTFPLALLPSPPSQYVIEAYEAGVDFMLNYVRPKETCHGNTW